MKNSQAPFKASALAVAMLVGAGVTEANAAVITTFTQGVAAATAAETAFLNSLNASVTETFDGFTADESAQMSSSSQTRWVRTAPQFTTSVGTFLNIQAGSGGTDEKPGNLMIESRATGEFGREVLASGAGDLWLDSNDARKVRWDFSGFASGFNAFGFYIADAVDQGATLTLSFASGDVTTDLAPFTPLSDQDPSNLGYLAVYAHTSILSATLTFHNSTGRDGWGIDDVTVGRVPEPGVLGLLGLALAGAGAFRRRRA